MIQKIPFKAAMFAMLLLLSLLLIFHFLIFTGIIPYQIIWGGKLKTVAQMHQFELFSIGINTLLILLIAIKGTYFSIAIPNKFITLFLWCFAVLFSLNTVANLFAEQKLETILFTPISLVCAVLCYRIALEKN